MDAFDAALLDRLQNDLPLVERPYAALGEALGAPEPQVLERVRAQREAGVVRQISAIFDTRRLGYRSMLVAARTPPERQDEAAAVFSAHPGVSHNYLREHDFNLWFTLAVPPNSRLGLERTVELLGVLAGVDEIRPMPALRFFKVGVDLDVKGGRDPAEKAERRRPEKPAPPPQEITPRQIEAIRALQLDLPTEPEPFAAAAARHGFTVAELLERGREFLRTGQMRRFAAVLAHRTAGFVQNGMGVWRVPEDEIDEVGRYVASFRGVSHCYQRPTYPDWPYNLFSMTHGRTKDECQAVLDAISRETGLTDFRVLYSTREYKKTRVSYFTPEAEAWEEAHAPLLCGVVSARRLQHVSVAVPPQRVEECAAWYVEVLQMERIPNLAGLAWLRFGDGDHVHLLGGEPPRSGAHFAVQVDDLAATLERCRARGTHTEQAEDLWGSDRWFTQDPAGNRIELFERSPG